MRPAIGVTGLGAMSALGTGVRAIVDAMREGRDGLREMERLDLRALHPIRFAGWLREPWVRGEPASLAAWAGAAAREAWDDASADSSSVRPERIAVVVGTSLGDEGAATKVAEAVCEATGARGLRCTITTACASSTNAIGLGRDLLLEHDADLVIAGGAEKLVAQIFGGFAALGVLASEKCAPFGETMGTTLGEGAGFVVLERAGERPVRAHAYVTGYGLSSDAWHETSPDPRGDGMARAMIGCMRDAAIEARDVEYVNAHATGTAANDDSEWRGIQRSLGARAGAIPVSGSKGFFGHAQGAAGVLEAIATIACMREGLVPPSLRIGRGRPRGPVDPVGETGRARAGTFSTAPRARRARRSVARCRSWASA
jgi:3-oxoacyl-[acyl-carrier-protein] synthase II